MKTDPTTMTRASACNGASTAIGTARPASGTLTRGGKRPLHIRETEEAIEAIRTLARQPKED
jgi:hypothetical protein